MASTIEILLRAQDTATADIARLQAQLKALNAQVVKNTASTNTAATANRNLATSFTQTSGAAKTLLTTLTAFGGLVLFVDAVRTIGQFEQALAGVNAVIETTPEQFERIEETARSLGATTVFSATEAAEGLQFLGRAGFEAEEAIGAIEGVLNLAAAGSLDLARAADIASNVISGFGLEATEAGRVADVLASAAQNANTNVEQLGEAFSLVAPVSAAFGISVEETAAALGILGNAGIQASSAGTGLRAVLATLGTPTNKLNKLLEQVGLTFEQVNPATNDLTDIMELLATRSIGAGDALEVFGRRGAPAILSIVSQVTDLRELNDTIDASGGTAERTADILSNTLVGSVKELRSAFQEFQLQLGEGGLLAALDGFVKGVTGVIRVFTNSLDPLDENAVLYRTLATVVETAALALGAFVTIRIAGFLVAAASALNTFVTASVIARAATFSLAGAVTALRAAVLLALGPVGWIIALGGALIALANNQAEKANQKLLEIDATLKLIDATVADLSLGELEQEAANSAANIDDLKNKILELNAAAEVAQAQNESDLLGSGRTFGFDDGSGEVDRINAQALRNQASNLQDQLDLAVAGNERINQALEKARAEDVADREKKDAELKALDQKRIAAELDAAAAAQRLKAALLDNELALAKETSDEILAIELSRLQAELEAGQLTTEEFYAGKLAAALTNLDAEVDIEQRKQSELLAIQLAAREALAAEEASVIDSTRGDEAVAIQRATFAARRQALLDSQAQERIDVESALTELGLRETQIRSENTQASLKAIADRDKKALDLQKKADAARIKEFEEAFETELALIETQADRRRQQLERQRASGETTGFEADAVAVQIDQEEIDALNALTAEFAELNEEVGSSIVNERLLEVGDTVVELAAKVPPELEKLNQSIDDNLVSAFESVIDGTLSVEDAFKQMVRNVLQQLASSALTNAISGFGASLTSAFSSGAGGGGGGGAGAFASIFASFFGKGGLVRAAEGGYITGSGTATSDSIPARLSDGEYVMQARAVQHYGPNFMEAINRMALANSQGFKKFSISRPRRAKFAEGGFVDNTGADSGAAPAASALRVVNVVDTDQTSDYLASSDGESMIVNIIRRNGSQIKQLIR